MNTEDFNKVVDARIEKIKATLIKKAAEYSSDEDRLHNFKIAGRINGETPEKALWGMMAKHLVSVIDIIADSNRGKLPSASMRDEKLGDAINYLILLEALLIEKSPLEPLHTVVKGTCAELHYKTAAS
jgi:hypothetical protein